MMLSTQINKILDYFRRPAKTAQRAKERLQIIIAHERTECDKPDYIALMQKDLLAVIAKYVSRVRTKRRLLYFRVECGVALSRVTSSLPRQV